MNLERLKKLGEVQLGTLDDWAYATDGHAIVGVRLDGQSWSPGKPTLELDEDKRPTVQSIAQVLQGVVSGGAVQGRPVPVAELPYEPPGAVEDCPVCEGSGECPSCNVGPCSFCQGSCSVVGQREHYAVSIRGVVVDRALLSTVLDCVDGQGQVSLIRSELSNGLCLGLRGDGWAAAVMSYRSEVREDFA